MLRRLEAVRGQGRAQVLLDCRGSFGSDRMRMKRVDGSPVWVGRTGDLYLRWTGVPPETDVDARRDGSLAFETEVDARDSHDLVLETSDLLGVGAVLDDRHQPGGPS